LPDDPALITRLVAGFNNGDDLGKLAAAEGISLRVLYARVKDHPDRITRQQRQDLIRRRKGLQLARFYNAGYSLRRLEQMTDLSYGGVRSLLLFVGVKLRTPQGAARVKRRTVPEAPAPTAVRLRGGAASPVETTLAS
jgi:hypothetical protein